MLTASIIQGRLIGPAELQAVRDLLVAHPDWSQFRLSRELCGLWDWRTATGQLKDMAARSLLLKLEARGLVQLPARRCPSPNRMRHKRIRLLVHRTEPITDPLEALQPLEVQEVSRQPAALAVFDSLLHQYHYLGYTSVVGQNLKYLVRDRQGRELACVLFGAAAWKCAPRDQFIGWSAAARQAHLQQVTNNCRFLLLPWVEVAQLASHLLSRVLRRVPQDWQRKYARPLDLIETFVDSSRFTGACYRAANWIPLGQTTGRTRQDRDHRLQTPPKGVRVYPLHPQFRRRVCA